MGGGQSPTKGGDACDRSKGCISNPIFCWRIFAGTSHILKEKVDPHGKWNGLLFLSSVI